MIIFLVGNPAAGKTAFGLELQRRCPTFEIASDLDELKLELSRSEHGLVDAPRIRRVASGGFEVLDPRVWDDCLDSVAQRHEGESDLILEFSRGEDQLYLDMHNIEWGRAYDPSFAILSRVFDSRIQSGDALIVLVEAAWPTRRRRNWERRLKGEHFVDAEELARLYRRECFTWNCALGEYAALEGGPVLPVVNLQNESGSDILSLVDRFVVEWMTRD